MSDDPERAYSFTRLLYNVHQNLGNELAEFLDLKDIHTLIDIGGGSGVQAMSLARKQPDLSITVVDIENVCTVGRVIVEENKLSDRIIFHTADFLVDELPQGFDFVLHCDIGVFGVGMFRKLWMSLKAKETDSRCFSVSCIGKCRACAVFGMGISRFTKRPGIWFPNGCSSAGTVDPRRLSTFAALSLMGALTPGTAGL